MKNFRIEVVKIDDGPRPWEWRIYVFSDEDFGEPSVTGSRDTANRALDEAIITVGAEANSVTSSTIVEKVAIEMAMGNNGGTWATHYNEDQKDVWRHRAKRIIVLAQNGHSP